MSHSPPPPSPSSPPLGSLIAVVVLSSNIQTIVMDTLTGRPRGNGYVTMSTDAEALAAIQGMNGQQYDYDL